MVKPIYINLPELPSPVRKYQSIMSLNNVPAGRDLPNDFNVIIEIPMNADPIKYEVDKETGAIFVDRFMGTAMHYPCNYGYIPQTLSDDGDPVDVLVITPFPLFPGVVVRCRTIGVLKMTDESGGDAKLLAVPVEKILPIYKNLHKPEDLNELQLRQIQHFFEHYKDLEAGKWVKIEGWFGPEEAKAEIMASVAAYAKITDQSQV
jgi:inorganic pyrophosphatase